MGLDFLDITFRIERTFGIAISNDDLGRLVRERDITAGDLYDYILRQMHLRDTARYDIRLNFELWAEVQHVIHSVTHVPLDRIELKTPLDRLFPRRSRRHTWQALRRHCPYRIRELDYPQVVRTHAFVLAAAVVVVEQLQLWQFLGIRWLWPALGLLGVWMIAETYMKLLSFLAPLRTCFPSGMTTAKDLCRSVLAANYDDICRQYEPSNPRPSSAVWEQLCEIIALGLGVDAEEVTFQSRLTEDLGMS